jgi:hypothetical protein
MSQVPGSSCQPGPREAVRPGLPRSSLAAKHRLVYPDDVLAPYDMRLSTNHRTSPPIRQWGARVKDQLELELAGLANVTLVALAGEQYRTAIRDVPGRPKFP